MTAEAANLWSRLKNLFHRRPAETVRETIEDLIEEAGAEGGCQLTEHEQLLLNNVLYLKDKKCCHTMIPRSEIVAFHKDGTVRELADLMISKGHSRVPVYGDSLDDIIGIVHILDVAQCLIKNEGSCKVDEMLTREVKFVSPTVRVADLLREMQSSKVHMAVVVDEYGGVDGLITIEDLLEEIVGDIEDEYDFDEQHVIMFQDDSLVIADARSGLDEIKAATGLDLSGRFTDENQEIDTLGGYVFNLAQRIPARGETIDGPEGVRFRILDVDPRRIKKIMIVMSPAAKGKAHARQTL